MWKTLSEASQQPAASSELPRETEASSASSVAARRLSDQQIENLIAENEDALRQIVDEQMRDDIPWGAGSDLQGGHWNNMFYDHLEHSRKGEMSLFESLRKIAWKSVRIF